MENIHFPKDLGNYLLFSILIKKLDTELITRFELHHNSDNIPTYEELLLFLEQHWNALKNIYIVNKILDRKSVKQHDHVCRHRLFMCYLWFRTQYL